MPTKRETEVSNSGKRALDEGRMNKATGAHARPSPTRKRLETPERILIVDDAKAARELISRILTAAGYECCVVSSAYEALALLKAGERFDLMACELLNSRHGITLLERTKDSLSEVGSGALTCFVQNRSQQT